MSAARRDFLHKTSTDITKSHGMVVLEKLEVRNMVRSASGTIDKPRWYVRAKAGLNGPILDQEWRRCREMLGHRPAEGGGLLIEVPQNTSCAYSVCRAVQRFRRTSCGYEAHADTNAAVDLLQRAPGTRLLPVEASRKRAGEAGTSRRVA